MRLLFDQNISYRILKKLVNAFPESNHVLNLGLENSTDQDIWNYALKNDYTIVTFDGDFFDLSNLYGHPPKIVWLRFGNTTTQSVSDVIQGKTEELKLFMDNVKYPDLACLEIL